jgi:hypothetical protein
MIILFLSRLTDASLADAMKLDNMTCNFESIFLRKPFLGAFDQFQLLFEEVVILKNGTADCTDEVMMVLDPAGTFGKLVSRATVPEIEFVDHAQLNEEVECPIYGGKTNGRADLMGLHVNILRTEMHAALCPGHYTQHGFPSFRHPISSIFEHSPEERRCLLDGHSETLL